MSYRRKKEDVQAAQLWLEWIAQNGRKLQALGVPSGAYATYRHWEDFLLFGEVNDRLEPRSPWWSFTSLSRSQMRGLVDFLIVNADQVPAGAGLPGFLRTRLSDPR